MGATGVITAYKENPKIMMRISYDKDIEYYLENAGKLGKKWKMKGGCEEEEVK